MKLSINKMVKVSVLASLSFIIMWFEIPIPFMPSFLQIDFSEVPALLAAFSLGPISAIMVELIKNILHLLLRSQTSGIGELANFLVGISFVVPAGLIYKYGKNKKSAIISLVVSTISMVIFASLFNYFILLPLYASVLDFPTAAVVGMGTSANEMIIDVKTFIAFAVAPFNLLKGIIVSLIVAVIYKKLSPILHKHS
jgi:riboflavin transporter